jgi:cyclopropane-fatty-acyl-phospholipid synthase
MAPGGLIMKRTSTMTGEEKTAKPSVEEQKELSHAKTGQKTRSAGIFEKVFVSALSRNQIGALHVRTMDRSYVIGDESDTDPAIIYVNDRRFFSHVVLFGEVGFGEAYMLRYFDSPDLYRVLEWFLQNAKSTPTLSASTEYLLVGALSFYNRLLHLLRPNSESIAKKNIAKHYDIGNALYREMLDPTMAYSSAIYQSIDSAESLEQAQIRKFERICEKLNLRPGLHLLEIGSGWGGFAIHVAKHYDVRVTTITISEEQYAFAKERIEREGLSDFIDIRLQDFRRVQGCFDRIVSIEMAEALGQRYFDVYFKKIASLLSENGLALLQYINYPESRYDRYVKSSDFIQKHIFPGGQLLSHREVLNSLHRTGDLCLYDLESFGLSYARSLQQWRLNFNASLDRIRSLGYDETFIRKWNYYLTSCEVAFTERYINVCQILLSRPQNRELPDTAR